MDQVVVLISVGAVLTMTAAAALVYRRMLPPMPSLSLSVAIAAVGAATWLAFVFLADPELAMELKIPGAALAAFAAFMATIVVRSCGLGFGASVLFALGWTVLVFVPVAMISFTGLGPLGLRPIDQGGSLAINVAAGAAALGGLVATRSRTRLASGSPLPSGMATAGVVALSLGWLVGSELAVDELTPTILINGLAGAAGGVAGWLLVQRIRHQSTTLAAVAAGLVSGLVAVSAGSAMYAPVAAFAAAMIASSAACLFTLSRVGHSARQQWFIVGSHLIAGAIGLVALGLFGNDFGFLFTGQYVVLRDQVVCCILIAAYSMGVSMGLWYGLRRAFARTPVLQQS
ncbi:MAG: hypothetical protein ABL886_06170 [Rhodoglobus sp.]